MKDKGRYGQFGGYYVPEVLMPALEEMELAFEKCRNDAAFCAELKVLLEEYAGRPTALYESPALSERVGARANAYDKCLLRCEPRLCVVARALQ